MEIPTIRRTRIELTNLVILRQAYNKKYSTKIKPQLYRDYVRVIMNTVKSYVIDGGFLALPYEVGNIFVQRKIRNLFRVDGTLRKVYVNWHETYKLRKEKYPEFTVEDWKKPENKMKCIIIYDLSNTGGYTFRIQFKPSKLKHNRNVRFYYLKPITRFSKQLGKYINSNTKIPTYYESNQVRIDGYDNREIDKRIAEHNKDRQRRGYRKYLRSIEENGDKTE